MSAAVAVLRPARARLALTIAILTGVALIAWAAMGPATSLADAGSVSVSDSNDPAAGGAGVTPDQLAQSLAGPGVTVSNVTYTGSPRAAGAFTNGAGSIGFDSGVVLSSGKVESYPGETGTCSQGVEGPNDCYEAQGGQPAGPDGGANTTSFSTPGDPSLDSLLPAGQTTNDAAVLEFDFVPKQSTVSINYVFGSEEYSDFVGSFDDVFGFFVNGQNCALVPGTTDPVSVNTINNGNDGDSSVAATNPQFFRDNVRPTGPTIDTQMDGLTSVLTCTASVTPGVSNHMKLAIADTGDTSLDSAVFLQSASLTSGINANPVPTFSGAAPLTINGPVATFSDSTPSATASSYSATINWGDGTTSAGTISGSSPNFGVNGSHTYANGGSFTITVTITAVSNPANTATVTDHANVTGKPVIQPGPAINTTTSQAFLAASLQSGGLQTTYHFDYGIDSKYRLKPTSGIVYDQRTPDQVLAANSAQTVVTANASPLLPNALYHARLVATNSAGTVTGPDIAFRTKADPKALPKVVLGKDVNATGIKGRVFIKLPGSHSAKAFKGRRVRVTIPSNQGYIALTEPLQLPTGTKVDSQKGSLTLVTASRKKSKTQKGTFGGALFSIAQKARGASKALTTLSLLEGAFPGAPTYASCKKKQHSARIATAGPSAVVAKLSSKVLQTLKASAHGRFRTKGRYSAGTVRGTQWGTSDRCDGTLTIVRKDTVAVTDFTRHRTVLVHAGHRYLAPAKKSK